MGGLKEEEEVEFVPGLERGVDMSLVLGESDQVALQERGQENKGCVCSKVLDWWAIKYTQIRESG